MAIFFKAEEKIRNKISEYFDRVHDCMKQFHSEIEHHIRQGPGGTKKERGETHNLESRADDLRRDIEMRLYGQALMPESRGDLLGMLETMDKVPNAAETVLSIIETERIEVPEQFRDAFLELVDCNIEAYRLLQKTADALFENPKQTLYVVKEVDVKESESDRMERLLISDIFDSDLDTAQKILLKDVVVAIGDISDRAESAGDRMAIMAMKRRI
jgi:hypothetical protein